MAELIFEVTQESDGGYCAECLTSQTIFTQGRTWDDLRANVREAVQAYLFDLAPFAERDPVHPFETSLRAEDKDKRD